MKALNIVALTLFAAYLFTGQAYASDFSVDKSRSSVKWNGKKVTGEHYGDIKVKDAAFQVENNAIKGGSVTIDMTTMTSEDIKDENMNGRLIGHLKSDDFFSVDKFPVSTMVVRSVRKLQGNEYEYSGDLTIKGITKPVTFVATTLVEGKKLTAQGKITVNRALYDIRFRSGSFFQNLGDNLIYDDFTLDFNITANSL